MINALTARYVRNGKKMTVEFSRDPSRGPHWKSELWIETEDGYGYEGRIGDYDTDLDSVVATAGRYMDTYYPHQG